MSNNSDMHGATPHFLYHPEIKHLVASLFTDLVAESDRGAVLIGATHVDFHLRKLFEAIAPQSMTRNKLKRILDYPGALSSFAAKTDFAYLTRLIPENLTEAIHHLRRVRNDVAHSPDSFRLADHKEQLWKLCELDPGIQTAVNRCACEAIVRAFLENIAGVKNPVSEVPIFDSPQAALDYLTARPELIAVLDEKRPRVELALGVVLICGIIVSHREKLGEALRNRSLLETLFPPEIDPA